MKSLEKKDICNGLLKNNKEDMNIVIVGHVDHGKSTIIGRLLADTNSLSEGKLEQVKEICRRNSKPFEYAFLLDALKDEQEQGITIDSARCFFNSDKRNYTIIDAPGHLEFLKNMITGAARAEAALLVIDAKEGVRENSRRHAYMLSTLGIRQIAVLINKMDLVDYNEEVFNEIVNEFKVFSERIGIFPRFFIPVSGIVGDNIALNSEKMSWYYGKTVLEVLDIFEPEKRDYHKAFRMPVQGVYKFTSNGDNRRIVAGTVLSGQISVGDEILFYPSGKKSTIKSIEAFNKEKEMTIRAGYATGIILDEQIYVKRGEIAVKSTEVRTKVTSKIKVNLFWLGNEAMIKEKKYIFKLGTSRVTAVIEEIINVIDASNLEIKDRDVINKHDISECVINLDKPIAFDLINEIKNTSRFVIIDNYQIAGGGIILEALEDTESWVRERVILRNNKWERSMITQEERKKKYMQTPKLLLITGEKNTGKKLIAKSLEKKLFNDNKIVYFIGITNILYGVDADIKGKKHTEKREHLRRLAEVANLMLDAGMILIVTALEFSQKDLNIIQTSINDNQIETVWIGDKVTTDISYDLLIEKIVSTEEATNCIIDNLINN